MPELPEVERVRMTLARHVIGRRIVGVRIAQPLVVHGPASPEALMLGSTISGVLRHGKHLAILSQYEPSLTVVPACPPESACLAVHLGMSGSLRYRPPHGPVRARKIYASGRDHIHVVWSLDAGGCIEFQDPRRFGGIWPFESFDALRASRWRQLGPDALQIPPAALARSLGLTRRCLKAALLDQTVVAGLGNIYVDELLHACGWSPLRRADALCIEDVKRVVAHMRRLLRRAIAAGGSTLRDYADAEGQTGGFQLAHKVYGRGGKPCLRCQTRLRETTVAGRTTVYCARCQTS